MAGMYLSAVKVIVMLDQDVGI